MSGAGIAFATQPSPGAASKASASKALVWRLGGGIPRWEVGVPKWPRHEVVVALPCCYIVRRQSACMRLSTSMTRLRYVGQPARHGALRCSNMHAFDLANAALGSRIGAATDAQVGAHHCRERCRLRNGCYRGRVAVPKHGAESTRPISQECRVIPMLHWAVA